MKRVALLSALFILFIPAGLRADTGTTTCLDLAITWSPMTITFSDHSPGSLQTIVITGSDMDADHDSFIIYVNGISSDLDLSSCNGTNPVPLDAGVSNFSAAKDPGTSVTSAQVANVLNCGGAPTTYTISLRCYDEKLPGSKHFLSAIVPLQVTVQ